MNKEGIGARYGFAFSQIFLLVFSIFSISFAIYESSNVSAGPLNQGGRTGSIPYGKVYNLPNGGTMVEKIVGGKVLYEFRRPGSSVSTGPITDPLQAQEILKGMNSDINLAGGLNTAGQNILQGYSGSLGSVSLGQTFGTDGLIKVGSIQPAANGEMTVTFVDKLGNTVQEITGKPTDSISGLAGSAAGNVPYSYKVPFLGMEITNFLAGNLVEGLVWSLGVVSAIQLFGGLAGFDSSLTNALSYSAVAGIMSGKLAYGLIGKGGSPPIFSETLTAGQFSTLLGIGVAVGIFLLTYKDTEKKVVTFECLPWEAPIGGSRCEECNSNSLIPCSEYRCKSLGQACDIVNKGTPDESCVWVNPKDVNSPTITPWPEALTDGHGYTNHETLPPSLGAKIVKLPDNCIQAFTPLEFGIVTNEPAQCKIDIARSGSFDNMTYYFEDSLFKYNHTEKLNLPSPGSLKDSLNGTDAPELPLDGIYNFFVRCRDANGNENEQDFVFQLCVDPSPDTTPPLIVDTSIKSGSYVSYGSDSVDLDVYVNEPSDCKWDIESKAYEEMLNPMTCSREIYELNAQQLYTCTTTLTGIKDREDNDFYFRCKDQPLKLEEDRNVNTQSYKFTLKGSQPLSLLEVGPNGTIFGSTESVQLDLRAETRNGAEEGKATCYFSPSGEEGSYIAMFNTDSHTHSQSLTLTEGNYEYFFRCVDSGGNSDVNSTKFSVEVDKEAPLVTRAYRADGLKIVTDEDAECSYSLNSCNYEFEEGIRMIYSNPSIMNVHFAEWTPNLVYYIKCRDLYNNQPAPNECSIIASSSNVR